MNIMSVLIIGRDTYKSSVISVRVFRPISGTKIYSDFCGGYTIKINTLSFSFFIRALNVSTLLAAFEFQPSRSL
jgi:hypothetical protein